ncbi:hypothetical protein ACO0TC_19235 [Pseudomonas aeruginosa]|uniref:hypothetical protein n=1 Tax=Pseudomonas aeruginosa TaxID=287 RepID=UPI003BF1E5C1
MSQKPSEPNLAERIFWEEHSRYPKYRIHYYVPHFRDDARTASLFMAFWPGILFSVELLELAILLPYDVRELKSQRGPVVISRLAEITSPTIIPITIESLKENIKEFSDITYKCVISNDRTYERISELISASDDEWLHISTSSQAFNELHDTSTDRFESYIFKRTDKLLETGEITQDFFESIYELVGQKRPPWKRIQFPAYSHGITRPNEIIAHSLGAELYLERKLDVGCAEEYIPAVNKSCKAIKSLRKKFAATAPIETEICLTTEPIVWNLYKSDIDKELFNNLNESKETILALRNFVKSARKPSGYTKPSPVKSTKELKLLLENEATSTFIRMYQLELRAFGAILAIMNAQYITPVLRVESKINNIKGDLINLAACARGNSPHIKFKLCKLALRTQLKMCSHLAPKYKKLIDETLPEFSGISLVGDIPLEWISTRGLPLSLRHDVSRVPATPGNLSLYQSLRGQHVNISISHLKEILVVRSFDTNDKIKYHLERALDHFSSTDKNYPKYKIIDVETAEEFTKAINDFSGALMIFDGHGTMDRNSAIGSIVVGGKAIDVWELRDSIRMPPVVLLSACDTLPLDGNHGSSANGMLTLGAVTVLGTVLPVDAARSAIFISRLLFRISEYLPIIVNRASYVPWRSFMSGMLRMTFCTELIFALIEEAKIISHSDYERIQMVANFSINSLNPNWYDLVISEICTCSGLERNIVLEKCRFWGAMVDSLKYIQLGRPEKIRLRSKSISEAMEILMENKKISPTSIPTMKPTPSIF